MLGLGLGVVPGDDCSFTRTKGTIKDDPIVPKKEQKMK